MTKRPNSIDPRRPVAQVIPLRRAIFIEEQPAKPSPTARLAPIGALLLAPVAALMTVTVLVSLGTLLFWALMVVLLCAAIVVTGRRRGPVWSWARSRAGVNYRVMNPSSW
jgi:hypothetical protein